MRGGGREGEIKVWDMESFCRYFYYDEFVNVIGSLVNTWIHTIYL